MKIGHNIQATSDAKHKLLIAADTVDVNDSKALSPMIELCQSHLNQVDQKIDLIADKGYHSDREIKAAEELKSNTYLSPKESSSKKTNPAHTIEAFKYDQKEDSYTCPAGEILKSRGRLYNKKRINCRKSYQLEHYKTTACKGCELRSECEQNKLGRAIERTEYAEYIERNNQRVNLNQEYYKERQQIVEHQFGTLKRHRHFDYTLMTRKQNVMSDVYIQFILYNLKRSVPILSPKALIEKLKALKMVFLSFFNLMFTLKDLSTQIIQFISRFIIIIIPSLTL